MTYFAPKKNTEFERFKFREEKQVVQPETKNVIIAKRQDILKNAVTPSLEIKEKPMNSVKISRNRKQLKIRIPSKNHLLPH